MPRPLCPRENHGRYALDRRLGGPQSQSGRAEDKNLVPARVQSLAVQPVARCYTDWAIPSPIIIIIIIIINIIFHFPTVDLIENTQRYYEI
jgi:hypothetical protein